MGKLKQEYVNYFDEMSESGLFTDEEIVSGFSEDFKCLPAEARKLFHLWKRILTFKNSENE